MGMNDYSPPGDDDDTNNGGNGGGGSGGSGGGGGGGSVPPMPRMGNIPGSNTVTDMLINYNERFEAADPALFRDALISQTISVLISKNKPNPLLVGPAGVGKTRIVEEIARCIAVKSPLIPKRMSKSTVYELPLSNLVAGAGIVGALEERLAELIDFATDKANDAIIFIDEIHLLQDSHDPVYKKVSQILKPALARGDMRLIGGTTMNEAKAFDNDPAFQRRFTRLVVDEFSREQTVEILRAARPSYMKHYKNKVTISDETLAKLATIADENSRANSHRPDNALTLLDRAMADVVTARSTALNRATQANDHAAVQAINSIGTVSLGEAKLRSVAVRLMTGLATKEAFDENRILDQLARIRGQDEIVSELLDALRRDDLGTFPREKPLAWMFAGPSGVGKTEVAKIIAQELTNQPPIMLNMGEYSNKHDVSRLIGSGPGYIGSESDKELPFDTLESNPYRVILLDEIEKADRSIRLLFLTALDEGWMRTASGKIIDFSKTIVIATTNAGRDALTKPQMGFAASHEPKRLTHAELLAALKDFFEPEFLGRFTKLIAFSALNRELYQEILVGGYARERARIIETNPSMANTIPEAEDIDADLLAELVTETYSAEVGARPAELAARKLIEDAIMATRFPAATTPVVAVTVGSATPSDNQDEDEEESVSDLSDSVEV